MKNISKAQALQLSQKADVVLLDVQLFEDYVSRHLPRSIHIPLEDIDQIERIIPDKKKTLIVYCQKGIRSRAACDILSRKGYPKIYNIVNGIR